MFKVGDKVRIIHNNEGRHYGWQPAMDQLVNTEVTIHEIYEYGVIAEENDWTWAFESIELLQVDDKMKKVKPKVKAIRKKALSTVLRKAMNEAAGTVSYALRFSEMPDRIQAKDACNARMRWWKDYDNKGPNKGECTEIIQDVGVMSAAYNASLKQQYHKYVDWVVNSSPWSAAIITKNLGSAFRYGVKFNVDVPIHHIVAAGITLREGSEYKGTLTPLFSHVLDKGYSGNVAYLIGLFFVKHGNDYWFTGFNSGHHTLTGDMSWKVLKEFFKNGYNTPNLKPMRTSHDTAYEIFRYIAPTNDPLNSVRHVFGNVVGLINQNTWGAGRQIFNEDKLVKLADFITKELEG